jgi:hypothetical protein
MRSEVAAYLDEVKTHLHLDPRTERRVISELYTHFQEKVGDLEMQGMTEPEATKDALSSFGDARWIARLMYEAHSRGSWTEALIGCQPHLIIAVLFATHIWRFPVLLGAAFAAIMTISLLGWRRGAPNWLYSWMGYAALPLLLLAYFSSDPLARTVSFLLNGHGVPASIWHVAALVSLYAFTVWLVASTAVRAARRDWILLTLALLPFPVIGFWVFSSGQSVGLLLDALRGLESPFSRWDSAMADFFFVLGISTALFIRLRSRALKVGAVIVAGIIGSAAAANSIWSDLGVLRLVGLSLLLLLFLTIPILIRAMAGRDQEPGSPLPLPDPSAPPAR